MNNSSLSLQRNRNEFDMSPRLKVLRKVLSPPVVKGFKPYGPESPNRNLKVVNFYYEEYEAIRLSDYNSMNHQQASLAMGVSRPTFTRIYASALRKIALAFVEGRQIAIDGGKVYFDSDWYHCLNCGCHFNHPEKEKTVEACALCGSKNVRENDIEVNGETAPLTCNDVCVCRQCGFELQHRLGEPCNQQSCPVCHIALQRKDNPLNH